MSQEQVKAAKLPLMVICGFRIGKRPEAIDIGFSGPLRAREALTFSRDCYTVQPQPERAASDMIRELPSRACGCRWLGAVTK